MSPTKNQRLWHVLTLLFFLTGCGGGGGSVAVQPLLPLSRAEMWDQDIDQMIDGIQQRHPDPFTSVSRAVVQNQVAGLKAQIDSKSDYQIVLSMTELVALYGDAHTLLRIGDRPDLFARFPLQLWQLSDGFVVQASNGVNLHLLGSRLIGINGNQIETIVDASARYVSHENEPWLSAQVVEFMMIPEVLTEAGFIQSPEASIFTFSSPDGEIFEEVVTPMQGSIEWTSYYEVAGITKPLFLRSTDNYWFEYLETANIIYSQYNRASQIADYPFEQFVNDLMSTSVEKSTDRLIIDMRFNTGGDTSILAPHIESLAINFELYIIVGRLTFSTGLIHAVEFRENTNAILVGEPTGGKPNHFGEVRTFRLSHSRMTVQHSSRFFNLLPGDESTSLVPDIILPVTLDDFREGRDPFVQFILE